MAGEDQHQGAAPAAAPKGVPQREECAPAPRKGLPGWARLLSLLGVNALGLAGASAGLSDQATGWLVFLDLVALTAGFAAFYVPILIGAVIYEALTKQRMRLFGWPLVIFALAILVLQIWVFRDFAAGAATVSYRP